MSATADIETDKRSGIYSIPIQSVTTRIDTAGSEAPKQSREVKTGQISSDGTVSTSTENIPLESGEKEPIVVVFVVEEGKAVLKPVKTGIQDNTYIEITEGLDHDAEVIVAPYSAISRELTNGIEVEVVPQDDLFLGGKR